LQGRHANFGFVPRWSLKKQFSLSSVSTTKIAPSLIRLVILSLSESGIRFLPTTKPKILPHCHATQGKKVWLNDNTFAKHRATVLNQFAYLLGDLKGPKSAKTLFLGLAEIGCTVFSFCQLSFAYFKPPFDWSKLYYLFCSAISGKPKSLGCLVYHQIQDSIKASKSKVTTNLAPMACQVNSLNAGCLNLSAPKLSQTFDKNINISEYMEACCKNGTISNLITIKKGKPTTTPTYYPTIAQLIRDCLMKLSLDHQYQVKDLNLNNIINVLLKFSKLYLTDDFFFSLTNVGVGVFGLWLWGGSFKACDSNC
jgi:hypothetical protein